MCIVSTPGSIKLIEHFYAKLFFTVNVTQSKRVLRGIAGESEIRKEREL